jgi:hypothetical protein
MLKHQFASELGEGFCHATLSQKALDYISVNQNGG